MSKPRQIKDIYVDLGLTIEQVQSAPKLKHYIKEKLNTEQKDAIEYLRMSQTPQIEFFKTYDSCSITRAEQRRVPIEAFCLAAKVNPMNVLEALVAIMVRLRAQESAVLAAVAHPEVVRTTIDSAGIIGKDGARDREMLHKNAGFLPVAKGSQTIVQVNQSQSQQQATITTAPPPEHTIRRLTDRFNENRQRPVLQQGNTETIPAEIIETLGEKVYSAHQPSTHIDDEELEA